ncbi:MAG: hypothetical protein U0270_26130 [Labilithrix sp.]
MLVLDERIEARISVLATDGEDRQLALERHEALHDERRRAERLPRALHVRRRAQHHLSLAVVSEATRLDVDGQPDPGHRKVELRLRRDGGERGRGDAEPLEELLLVDAVLADLERVRRREYRHELVEEAGRADGDVLELVGHDVALARELAEALLVVVRADAQVPDVPGGRLRARVEEHEALAERVAGERDHPPELSPAEDPDRHPRRPESGVVIEPGADSAASGGRRGSGRSSTVWVWLSR